MFMDSDDTVEPTLFADVVASLEKNPAQVVVFGLVEDYYDAAGKLHHSVPVSYGCLLYTSVTMCTPLPLSAFR